MPEEDKETDQITDKKDHHDPGYPGIEDTEAEQPTRIPDVPERAMQEQIPSPQSARPPKSLIVRRLIMLLLALLLIGGIGVGAWKLIPSKDDASKSSSGQKPDQQSQDQSAAGSTDNSLSQTYTSDFLRLNFNYPGSWKVTEDNNAITVKSSKVNYMLSDGSETEGYFKIYIKKGASDSDGNYLGKGYAIAPSEKISYSQPAPGQRKETYLTNFGLDTPDNFSYFIMQGNFNLKKGDTLGPKFASEPDSFLVAGGFATDQDKDGLATQILSADSFAQNQVYLTALEIVKSLQLK